ncbi:MAG: 4Fe-4S binding protein [Syntrophomonadaceae bacterium]|nr:4Fe-4S binding protein [Syntrophomonadaceae bacterium]
MKEITEQIQTIAARLFEEGKIDIFIAWEQGELDFQTKAYVARSKEDAKNLVFNEYAIYNTANMLLKFRDGHERIGIAVKGCDSRGIVRLLEDLQIKRERLYIVGIPCPGLKDPLAAARNYGGFNRQTEPDSLAGKCLECIQPNPVICDEIIGPEQSPRQQGDRFARVKEMEQMTPDERYDFWEKTLSTCIRCYACRQVCVACDCRTCIFDEMKPQWVGRESSTTDNMMYHLVKHAHMAGRCIECGECERVCPVNIPLMLLNQKLIKDVGAFYGGPEAGLQYVEGAKPPLSVYRIDDPDSFL